MKAAVSGRKTVGIETRQRLLAAEKMSATVDQVKKSISKLQIPCEMHIASFNKIEPLFKVP